MRVLALFGLAAFAMVGCAKFPSSTSGNAYTHLIFRFRLNQPINPSYIYMIAVRPVMDTDSSTVDNDGHGPIPVVNTGSKNGFVEGWVPRYIQYDESVSSLYSIYKFPSRTTTSEDDNPFNLGAQQLIGQAYVSNSVDPRPAANGGTSYGTDLGFEIDTSYLVDDPTLAQHIRSVQFNILTMNKTALNSVGDRVIDALGDNGSSGSSTFNNYASRVVVSSNTFSNSSSTIPERSGDTYPVNLPPIDIVDWSLEVRTP